MKVIDDLMLAEGWPTYTDKPNDRGGPTKGGITLKTLQAYYKRPATVEELKALPEATARSIYEFMFITGPGFNRILDSRVRDYLIDIGVTSSPARAVRFLQYCLAGLKQDGELGPITERAANAAEPRSLLLRLVARRATMMAADVQNNPEQLENIEGWIARAVKPLLSA